MAIQSEESWLEINEMWLVWRRMLKVGSSAAGANIDIGKRKRHPTGAKKLM